jgi:hypothetical protein
MNSYLFLIVALADNRVDHRSWERYVSANSRAEALAELAIQLVNSKIDVLEIRSIEPKQRQTKVGFFRPDSCATRPSDY